MRGSSWTEIECFFAIWGYYQLDKYPNMTKSHLYEYISQLIDRTPKSVEYKIQNVSACDLRPREQKPVSQMSNAQNLLIKMFNELWINPEKIDNLYDQYQPIIQQGFPKGDINSSFVGKKDVLLIEEGTLSKSSNLTRKRSKKLVEEARKHYSRGGYLYCVVCGFSELDVVEKNIIQIHHLEPIADLKNETKILLKAALDKVRPVCPTCHSIIHSRKPLLSLQEAKQVLENIEQRMRNLR